MQLSKSFEKTINLKNGKIQHQELVISCFVSSRKEASELNYNDFKVDLVIDKVFVAEISDVMDKADIFTGMVDSVDWEEMYCEMLADADIPLENE